MIKYDGYKNQNDLEIIHSDRDEVYEKFIRDLASGKLKDPEESKKIARLINNKLVKKYKNVWYA